MAGCCGGSNKRKRGRLPQQVSPMKGGKKGFSILLYTGDASNYQVPKTPSGARYRVANGRVFCYERDVDFLLGLGVFNLVGKKEEKEQINEPIQKDEVATKENNPIDFSLFNGISKEVSEKLNELGYTLDSLRIETSDRLAEKTGYKKNRVTRILKGVNE